VVNLIDLFQSHYVELEQPVCVVISEQERGASKHLRDLEGYLVTSNIDLVQLGPDEEVIAEADVERYRSFYCAGDENRSVHTLYAKMEPAKRKGKVVVFGNLGRSLSFRAATWQEAGISITGMFRQAGEIVRFNEARGSYAEFGVFDGRSVSMAWQNLAPIVDNFLCFDSFGGIVGAAEHEEHLYPDGSYSANRPTFEHNMRVVGADLDRFTIVEGPFQETLRTPPASVSDERISIANIDSDVEEACSLALDFLKDRLIDNSFVLFDEYNAFSADPRRGERAAVSAFLRSNPDVELEFFRHYGVHGTSFIFRRRPAAST